MKTVGLLLDDPKNEYQQLQVREARLWAPRYDIEVQAPQFASGSSWTQLESIQSYLRQPARPDGVLVMLAGAQLTSSAFARLAKAGMAVVFLNRIPLWVDALRTTFPKALLAGVAPRQHGIGEVQAHHAFRLASSGGFILMMTGEARSQTSVERQQGFLTTVEKRYDIHALDGRWSSDGAAQALEEWFRMGATRDTPIALVVCHNDAMAAGVRMALAKQAALSGRRDLERVPLVGCDGLEHEGLAMVTRGELAATVVLPTTTPQALKLLRLYWDSGAQSHTILLEGTPFPPLAEALPR